MKYSRVFLFHSGWSDHVRRRVTPSNLYSPVLIYTPWLGLRYSQSNISVPKNKTKLTLREHELVLINSESCRAPNNDHGGFYKNSWFLRKKDSLTTTIASLSTLTAACKGVSPLSSRHLTSAPDLSSNSTMLTCLPRIALCSGVLPNESGEFTSGEERVEKLIHRIWPSLNLLVFKFSLHCIAYIAFTYSTLITVLATHYRQPFLRQVFHGDLQACLKSFIMYISLKFKLKFWLNHGSIAYSTDGKVYSFKTNIKKSPLYWNNYHSPLGSYLHLIHASTSSWKNYYWRLNVTTGQVNRQNKFCRTNLDSVQ